LMVDLVKKLSVIRFWILKTLTRIILRIMVEIANMSQMLNVLGNELGRGQW